MSSSSMGSTVGRHPEAAVHSEAEGVKSLLVMVKQDSSMDSFFPVALIYLSDPMIVEFAMSVWWICMRLVSQTVVSGDHSRSDFEHNPDKVFSIYLAIVRWFII